jgi:hypothetical protein
MLRPDPPYRRDAFARGLRAAGFDITADAMPNLRADDLLVIWNRYGGGHEEAQRFERAGARVIVAENGYLGREWNGGIWYSLALNWHNGHGSWNVGSVDRARDMFAGQIDDWRPDPDGPLLVLAQRGIGTAPVASPPTWAANAMHQCADMKLRVKVREHPGNVTRDDLLDELRGVRAVVTWASGAGIKSLCAGIPAYHGLADWIGAPAARRFKTPLPEPFLGDRWPFLQRLAWAMWRLGEIESGDAFRHLLRRPT